MKVKIVKGQLLQPFQEKFDILFQDPEFGYKADGKLVAMLCASLSYEHTSENKSMIKTAVVSNAIYFIFKGQVRVYYKDESHALVNLDEGSYFGEVSFIFQVLNMYTYMPISGQNSKFYSIQDNYLNEIFEKFPDFKNIL